MSPFIADTLPSGGELTAAQEALLRQKYLHQSAHWTPVMKHGVGPEVIFINRPNPYYGRYTHANRDAR
jgi:hypothetical protein